MNDDRPSRIAVVVGVAVALLVPASQALLGWGQSAGDFSAQGDQTLRVAGYAFSIWSLIYAGLLAYAVRRLIAGRTALQRAADWPLALASLGCGLWILAAGLDLRWATVAIIVAALAAAIIGLVRLSRSRERLGLKDRLTLLWPLALLAGWLTAASVVNVLTVLTAEQLIDQSQAPTPALLGLALAACGAAAVLLVTRVAVYALPVAWGLVGAYVAERGDQPLVAVTALACAVLLLLAAVIVALRGRQIS